MNQTMPVAVDALKRWPDPGAPEANEMALFDERIWVDAAVLTVEADNVARAEAARRRIPAVPVTVIDAIMARHGMVAPDCEDLSIALSESRVVLPASTLAAVTATLLRRIGLDEEQTERARTALRGCPGLIFAATLDTQVTSPLVSSTVKPRMVARCPQHLVALDADGSVRRGTENNVDFDGDAHHIAATLRVAQLLESSNRTAVLYTRNAALAYAMPHMFDDQSRLWHAVHYDVDPGGVTHPRWTFNISSADMASVRDWHNYRERRQALMGVGAASVVRLDRRRVNHFHDSVAPGGANDPGAPMLAENAAIAAKLASWDGRGAHTCW